jgi:hypothetical protein
MPNKIAIEGHTDSLPYGRQPVHELGARRRPRNAARRVLERCGVKTQQLEAVRGFADTSSTPASRWTPETAESRSSCAAKTTRLNDTPLAVHNWDGNDRRAEQAPPIPVLIVDDDAAYANFVRQPWRSARRRAFDLTRHSAERRAAGARARPATTVILSDVNLPDGNAAAWLVRALGAIAAPCWC